MPSDQLLRNQYFSLYRNGHGPEIRFLGKPVPEWHVAEAATVARQHVIPQRTERAGIEAAIYAVQSQGLTYERPLEFLQALGRASLEQLMDPAYIHKAWVETGARFKENRFAPILSFMAGYPGGVGKLMQDYEARPRKTRDLLDEVKYIGPKSASFIGLCWGIRREVLTIDVHVLRQAAGMGIDVKPSHYLGARRASGKTKGRNIQTHPNGKEYMRIEQKLLDLVENSDLPNRFPVCRNPDGSLNTALLTTLFWWAGAKGKRTPLEQAEIFPGGKFASPYERSARVRAGSQRKGQAPAGNGKQPLPEQLMLL